MKPEEKAKRIIQSLMRIGNFDEFDDHREPDGVHEGSKLLIADAIRQAEIEALAWVTRELDRHMHKAWIENEPGHIDTCRDCSLDLRDGIHLREQESSNVKKRIYDEIDRKKAEAKHGEEA